MTTAPVETYTCELVTEQNEPMEEIILPNTPTMGTLPDAATPSFAPLSHIEQLPPLNHLPKNSPTFNLQAPNDVDLLAYTQMLRGVLADGKINPDESQLLRDWATRHRINEEQHDAALSKLGWSAELYSAACQQCIKPPPEKETATSAIAVRLAGCLLAANAGFVNGAALSGMYDTAVSHVTGTTTRIGLGEGDVAAHVYLILSFVLGSTICGWIIGKNQVNFGLALYGFALLAVALLLLCSALAIDYTVAKYLAAMAMGLQNGMATTYSGAVIRTTHMTGCATDLGLLIGRMSRRLFNSIWLDLHQVDKDDQRADASKFLLLSLLLGSFIIGGALGGEAYKKIGYKVLFVSASLCFALGLGYMLYRILILKRKLLDNEADAEVEVTYDVLETTSANKAQQQQDVAGVAPGGVSTPTNLELRRYSLCVRPRLTRNSMGHLGLDSDQRRVSVALKGHLVSQVQADGSPTLGALQSPPPGVRRLS